MITAQPEGLEQISLDLKKSAEILEDITGQIMRLAGEMLDDFQIEEISGNPEIKSMVVSVNNDTARTADRLYSFSQAVSDALISYNEIERKSCEKIERINCTIDSLSAELGSLYSVKNTAIPDVSPNEEMQRNTELLVTGSVQELQMTNIAAISKVINEKYFVSAVKEPGSNDGDEDEDSE